MGAGDKHSLPPSWLPPQLPCLDSLGAALTVVSLHAASYSSSPWEPLLVPLPALGPPLKVVLAPLCHCAWGTLPFTPSPTTQHHVSKQLTQA